MAVRRRRRLRGRLARGDPLRLGPARRPGETKELTDTYYDTEDWRFYRAGYALRVRRDGKRVEATMKSLAPPEDGGLKRRREISEPLRSDGPKLLKSARGPAESACASWRAPVTCARSSASAPDAGSSSCDRRPASRRAPSRTALTARS